MTKFYTLILLFATISFFKTAEAQTKNLALKQYSAAELPSHTLHLFSNAVRTRYIQIDFSKLNEQSIFSLPLFDGQDILFRYKDTYQYKVGSTSWYGQDTEGIGDVILSFYQGNIKGCIRDNQMKKYMLQQINQSDIFAITEVNIESMQETPSHIPDYIELPSGQHKKSRANADVCAPGTSCGGASVIDLMVLGNADAIADAGGTVAAFITDVSTAVTEMNVAYTSSGGTLLSFDLVHCDSYAFIPTASSSADLSSFRNDAAVTALRALYFADLCGLWVGSGSYSGVCGIGYLNTNETNYSDMAAFTVTDFGCGMTNLTFAHECGHNMGLRHDYYVDGSTSPCDHHHGYVNQAVIPGGAPAAGRWRTIMAYNNECSDNGFNCSRLPRWANPSLNYLGDAMGRAIGMADPSDEIYGFERFRCVVSEFRNAGIPLPLQLITFTGSADGNNIRLKWQTSAEINSKGFDVEMRSTFHEDFRSVAFVAGKGHTATRSDYHYDLNAVASGSYYFRLRQSDLDGNFTYSNIVKVNVAGRETHTSLYPNPAKDVFTLSFYNTQDQIVRVSVYDLAGKEVLSRLHRTLPAGLQHVELNTTGLRSGVYFCHLICGNEKNITKLLID